MVLSHYPLRHGVTAALGCALLAMAAPPAASIRLHDREEAGFVAPPAQKLKRAADGLYYLPVSSGGAALDLLVDTGANKVVLTRQDAQSIGINVDTLHYSGKMETAAGNVRIAYTLLDGMDIGGRRFDHVPVVIADRSDGVSLMGQEMLARIGTMVLSRDGMELRHQS